MKIEEIKQFIRENKKGIIAGVAITLIVRAILG